MILPLAFPAVVAGSIFTFSLTLGDYITPELVSSTQFIGNVIYNNVGVANNLPFAAAYSFVPIVDHGRLSPRGASPQGVRVPLMTESRVTRLLLRLGTAATLVFIYLPLVGGRALRVQRERDPEVADRELTAPSGSPSPSTIEKVRDALLLSVKAASARPRSRSCSERSPRWRSPATASSGAR